MFLKQRTGQDNIGKLIVFAITIIIAVGFVGILGWFYGQKIKEKQIISVLGNISTSLKTLKLIGLCKTSTGSTITYTPIINYYILKCSDKLGKNLSTYPMINVLSGCKADDKFCKYKLLNH